MRTAVEETPERAKEAIKARRATYTRLAGWGVGLLLLIALPWFSSTSMVSLYNQIGIAIIFALAYNLLLGHSGLLSFGHAVYFGVGAFWTIQLMSWVSDGLFYFPTPLVPLAGGLGGLIFGIVLGFVCVRRHGTIFALITLAIGELMTALTLMLNDMSGGEEGISAWREPWMGLMFGQGLQVYYVILAWVIVCAALMYAFTRTPFGRIMLAVRDNAERAQFIGYSTFLVRLTVFAVSGLFSGVAGGLLAFSNELINYEVMSLNESAAVLFNTYIGGATYFSGPIIGAVVLASLQLNVSIFTAAWLVYQALLFIIVIMFIPTGLSGLIYSHGPVIKRRLMGILAPAYALAAVPGVILFLTGVFIIEFFYGWSHHGYAATPFPLFGVSWAPASLWPWLVMVVGLAAGLGGLRYVVPIVRERWARVNAHLSGEEPAA